MRSKSNEVFEKILLLYRKLLGCAEQVKRQSNNLIYNTLQAD